MDALYAVSIWLLPVLIAVTFHEAAHGYVARFLGDDTASRLGRVSLNPFRHIDLPSKGSQRRTVQALCPICVRAVATQTSTVDCLALLAPTT